MSQGASLTLETAHEADGQELTEVSSLLARVSVRQLAHHRVVEAPKPSITRYFDGQFRFKWTAPRRNGALKSTVCQVIGGLIALTLTSMTMTGNIKASVSASLLLERSSMSQGASLTLETAHEADGQELTEVSSLLARVSVRQMSHCNSVVVLNMK
jgi:hypothetical protein